jgi:hypothetical protein
MLSHVKDGFMGLICLSDAQSGNYSLTLEHFIIEVGEK